MQAIVKIYANQFATTPISQISEILDVKISYDVNSFDSATLKLAYNVPNIAQYRKVEIYSVEPNSSWASYDRLLFSGFIESFKPTARDITIQAKSEKALLYRKFVVNDAVYTTQTISQIMTAILTDWNTAYSETWSFSSSIATTITKTVKQWDNIYDILNELCVQTASVSNSIGWVITASVLLGTDYTSPSNYKELTYDGNDLKFSNMWAPDFESYWTISNIIIWSDGTTKSVLSDAPSRATYGALGELKSFRAGNLSTTTQNYLDRKKGGQFVYSVKPDWTKFDANVGDKVQMRVENVSSYFNYTWAVIINTKTVSIVNGTLVSEYTVSDKYVYLDTFTRRFLDLESDLDLNIVR